MIGLIDYNMGNLRSVVNAFEELGVPIEIVKKADELEKANCLKHIYKGPSLYSLPSLQPVFRC